MRAVLLVFRREMRSYFVSPVAYTLFIAFVALSGWYFYNLLASFQLLAASATEQATQLGQPPPVLNLNMGIMRPWFNITAQLFLFLMPIMTMRLLAEERGTGRLDMLISAPISDLQLVLGKYLAGACLCLLFIAATLVYPRILFMYGNPESGQLAAGYLGVVLQALALTALGLTVSSLTGSQVIAAAAGFGVAVLLWVLGVLAGSAGTAWGSVVSSISMVDHFSSFADGVIEGGNVVYYLSVIVLALYLTLRAVESQRWRG